MKDRYFSMKKIKEPKTNGIAKAPLIMQLEALECGAASLAMVMAYYDKWVSLETLREDIGIGRDGGNAKSISQAARKYGFVAEGYLHSTENVIEKGKFPCIIHWNKAHFVVLCGFSKNHKKAYINDPSKGEMVVPIDEFEKSFTGVYLEITPDETFEPSGERKSIFQFAKKRIVHAKGVVVFFSIITIALYLVALFDPLVRQTFIDKVLTGTQPEWLYTFIWIVAGVGLAQILATIIKEVFSLKLYGKMAYEGSSTFMWKILKLPISFFSQRMVGDIQERKDSNARIAETIVNVFAPLVLNAGIIVVYLVVMFTRSYILTLIGISFAILNAVISQLLVKKRINIQRVQARDAAMLSAATSKGIEMIETIKSSGAEDGFFEQWSTYKDAVSTNNRKLATIRTVYSFIPGLIYLIIHYGILFLGVALTIENNFTLGAVVGFQGLLAAFMTPAMSVITSGQSIQETRTEMERVEDVMNYKDDPYVTREAEKTFDEKITPNIEIKDLTFGYNILKAPLIKDFNLSIHEGEKIAIVGKTGCGKSTLAKLISGLYQPWSGEILFDGYPIIEINRETFTNSVSVVDQDVFLFEDTVMNNLKMWNKFVREDDVYQACKDADIYDDIMTRPGQFNYPLLEGGKNLSGGERQRVEIARALARNPTVLILDEATSALDAKTEDNIIKAVKNRGITCIVIAHRLSTIRDADKILVLSNGKVVEVGNHDELMKKQGYYYNLVTKE